MKPFDLTYLFHNGVIDPVSFALGRYVRRRQPDAHPFVAAAAAWVSQAANEGHVCLDVADIHSGIGMMTQEGDMPVDEISLDQRLDLLKNSPVVGEPGSARPLVLDGTRLYLHRLWYYEHTMARSIITRLEQLPFPNIDEAALRSSVSCFFSDAGSEQYRAVMTAIRSSFSIISGGPGSGKTHTIARLILVLKAMAESNPLRIALAAPTGKAAARLQDAVGSALSEPGLGSIAGEGDGRPRAFTLHRLMGYRPLAGGYRYDNDHPLPLDVLIIDEASMVDLGLMARVMAALPIRARLILVGDKDQLSSVEAGAVLGDICHGISYPRPDGDVFDDSAFGFAEERAKPLIHHITVLRHNYRFEPHGGIATFCRLVNNGDATGALALLVEDRHPDLKLVPVSRKEDLRPLLEQEVRQRLAPLFNTATPAEALEFLGRFRFLNATRKGPFGVQVINDRIEAVLKDLALLDRQAGQWYPFRPLMITRNDYVNQLFNGDIGITYNNDRLDDTVKVIFEDGKGGYRHLVPHQLPDHETVFAMTVHKSQGSEFNHVVLILPDRDTPLLTRELIYTAVTRARQSVAIWGNPSVLSKAIGRRIQRASGLRKALWG